MKRKQIRWRTITLFLVILTFLSASLITAACSRSPEQSPQPAKQNKDDKGQKPPKELQEMQSVLEKMVDELAIKEKERTEPSASPQSEGAAGEKQAQQKEGESSEQQKSAQGQGQQGGQQKAAEPGKVDWGKQMTTVRKLHAQWNSLEVEVVKAGAREQMISGFEGQLDDLTMQVEAKSLQGALYSANNLYGLLPEFAGLYKTDSPPDFERFRYLAFKSMLDVDRNDWEAAKKDIEELKLIWKTLKVRMEGKAGSSLIRTDYALVDLEKAINSQNREITLIKGEILLNDLKEIKKKAETEE